MRVVVTGTREGRPDVAHWLERFVWKAGAPELFILGCAAGVDYVARRTCEKRRWDHVVLYADEKRPSPERYHERNERMVRLASLDDVCLAFPLRDSRGTWHCANFARACGLRVHVLPLVAVPGRHPPLRLR